MNEIKLIFANTLVCFFSLSLLMSSSSCSGVEKKKRASAVLKENHAMRKPPGSFTDTITIGFPSAVLYNPDSLQLEKIKEVTDTGIFESLIHDCFYQMRYSRMAIQKDWPKVKIIEIRNARFLLFKSRDGSGEYIDLNTKNDPCGIFLFDGIKKATLVDMTNIETELGYYFEK